MRLTKDTTTQQLDYSKVKEFEHQLDDVMEIIDTNYLKSKVIEIEKTYQINSTEINKVKLGIIYHEVSLNLSFFSKTEYKGYSQKSYDILNELYNSNTTTKELLPFISSYRASALSLISSETKKLGLLFKAFTFFKGAVMKYSEISYLPEFMRGSVAENIPKLFFWLHKYAKLDFQSIIEKQDKNSNYANWKVMSFTYWAWAKQRQTSEYRNQAINYLDKAIGLDPNYQAGRKRAEELKEKLMKENYS